MNEPLSLGEPTDAGNNRFIFRQKAVTGQTYQHFCPCGETILVTYPKPGNIQFRCKNCQRVYAAVVTDAPPPPPPPPPPEDNDTANTSDIGVFRAMTDAVLVYGNILHRQKKTLYYGHNIIGRKDTRKPSDIEIDDPFISRCSVDVSVRRAPDGSGNTFRLQVLQTRNPVYVNNQQIQVNEQVYLNYNDQLKLGNTLMTLKKK